ncbi:MAG: phosphate ABC transporter permease PstA [Planctomycetaceae bacterium]
MTALVPPNTEKPATTPAASRKSRRRGSPAANIIARGEPMVWLTGGALALCMVMIIGLLVLVLIQGSTTFWPTPVIRAHLQDDSIRQGEVVRRETFELTRAMTKNLPAESQQAALTWMGDRETIVAERMLVRVGNFELTNTHYEYVYPFEIQPDGLTYPEWAMTIERMEWGRFFGTPAQFIVKHTRVLPQSEQELKALLEFFETNADRIPAEYQQAVQSALSKVDEEYRRIRQKNSAAFLKKYPPAEGMQIFVVNDGGDPVESSAETATDAVGEVWHVWSDPSRAFAAYEVYHNDVRERRTEINSLEKHELGEINSRIEEGRLALRQIEMAHRVNLISPIDEAEFARLEWSGENERLANAQAALSQWTGRFGDASPLVVAANRILAELNEDAASRHAAWENLQNELREQVNALPPAASKALESMLKIQEASNYDTQRVMTQIDELRQENDRYEFRLQTAQGAEVALPLAEIVRAFPANKIGYFDRVRIYVSRWEEFLLDDPRESNSEGGVFPAIWGTMVMTVLMSLAVVPFGVLSALYLREYAKKGLVLSAIRISINNLAGVPSIVFGVFGLGFFCYIIGASIDELFFSAKLPNPTFGKGGLIWASFTLALLTLPVVIVATEEALAAVPNSMREGSYACGASKWQTIRRIVLPRALPGIMTGAILAMARGAGEVAPLMLVGAVKLAPELPVDHLYPFFHGERSFMHLGFHIYDLGFQSQNSEAAKPMVFTTTLLLIVMITLLNVSAIWLRGRLRNRFRVSQF